MTSGFTINHVFVKILNIINKYITLAVRLKNQLILHFYKYISKQLNMNCLCGT